MPTPYSLAHTFNMTGSDLIYCMEFSPDGVFLASGDENGNLVVFDVTQRQEVYRTIISGASLVCLKWDPQHSRRLFCGSSMGDVFLIDDFKQTSREVLTGARGPVYAIDMDPVSAHLAVAVGEEVHVAKKMQSGPYYTFSLMPHPDPVSEIPQQDNRVRARSLHLYQGGEKLIVSYLNHGVVCWDVGSRVPLWHIVPPSHPNGHIGFSALSLKRRCLLISNLHSGMDAYYMGQSAPFQSYKQAIRPEMNVPLQVSFLHGGKSVICGSTTGGVNIWDTETAEHQQTLKHGAELVQVVCAHQRFTRALVATAGIGGEKISLIKLWIAEQDDISEGPIVRVIGYIEAHDTSAMRLLGLVAVVLPIILCFPGLRNILATNTMVRHMYMPKALAC
ncbi:WD40 repeat-like protein [Artomyces pyxidatus]|uniref:WD40 repeat-like protein n=1 Tax=Artomyces pyxidatus TaxID=48021 RepID=A0ACB8SDU1_9AGAM|nr:WD40 repeat-like protein [Artomyces pyxidatus]